MQKIKIFVSYSHQNEDWVSKEGKYKLIPWLERQLEDQADIWTDHELKKHLGDEFTKLITGKIMETDIVLLLISQDFVTSKYITDVELPLIRKYYQDLKIKILPLLLTNLTKKGKEKISWIFDLQTYPNDTKPLIDFVNNDSEWEKIRVEILEGVENKIDEIKNKSEHSETGKGGEVVVIKEVIKTKNNWGRKFLEIIKEKKRILYIGVFFLVLTVSSIYLIYQSHSKVSAQLLNKNGCNYVRSNEIESAIGCFKKSILADSLFDSAYYNLGIIYLQLKKQDSAIYYMQKTNQVNPLFTDSYNQLGKLYLLKKDFNNSISEYLKTIKVDSTNFEANLALGKIYLETGVNESSIKAYERILTKEPDTIDALIGLAIAKKGAGFYEASIDVCSKIIKINPNNAEGYFHMGNAYNYLHKHDKQIECYIKAAKLGNKASINWLDSKKYNWK